MNAWAAAFESGGLEAAQEAEQQELRNIRREKDEADERNFRAFEQMIRQGQAIRRQREEQETRDGTFFPRPGGVEYNPFSGEAIVDVPEDDSLRLAREARWGTGVATGVAGLIGAAQDDASDTDSNPAVTTSGSDSDSTAGETFTYMTHDAQAGSDAESTSSYGVEDEREFAAHLDGLVDALPPAPPAAAAPAVAGSGWTSINIIEEDEEQADAPPPPTPYFDDDLPPPAPSDTSTDLCELD